MAKKEISLGLILGLFVVFSLLLASLITISSYPGFVHSITDKLIGLTADWPFGLAYLFSILITLFISFFPTVLFVPIGLLFFKKKNPSNAIMITCIIAVLIYQLLYFLAVN